MVNHDSPTAAGVLAIIPAFTAAPLAAIGAGLHPARDRLDGVPLLAWPIATAMAAPSVISSIVVTDDDATADLAENLGCPAALIDPAVFSDRPSATDAEDAGLALGYAAWLERGHRPPAAVAVLSVTTPLRPRWLIHDALDALLKDPRAQRVVSVQGQHADAPRTDHTDLRRPGLLDAHGASAAPATTITIPAPDTGPNPIRNLDDLDSAASIATFHAHRLGITHPRQIVGLAGGESWEAA